VISSSNSPASSSRVAIAPPDVDLFAMNAITLFGICGLTFMMVMYAGAPPSGLRHGVRVGCLLSSAYGFLSGAWPFGGGRDHPGACGGPAFLRFPDRPIALASRSNVLTSRRNAPARCRTSRARHWKCRQRATASWFESQTRGQCHRWHGPVRDAMIVRRLPFGDAQLRLGGRPPLSRRKGACR
jgi:hypothetical protein